MLVVEIIMNIESCDFGMINDDVNVYYVND